MSEPLECIEAFAGACEGPVEYRHALSASGRSFPRCARHWAQRLEKEQELSRRYPVRPPADWSPLDAGEAWDEEGY